MPDEVIGRELPVPWTTSLSFYFRVVLLAADC
jgi:hypothetical protein